jgi:hypothetical protein
MRKIVRHFWNFPQGPDIRTQNTPPMRYLESERPGTTSALITDDAAGGAHHAPFGDS